MNLLLESPLQIYELGDELFSSILGSQFAGVSAAFLCPPNWTRELN